MIGCPRLSLLLGVIVVVHQGQAYCQAPGPASLQAAEALQPDPLPGLPHLGDQPASLFAPPAPPNGPPLALPGPYFEADPRLDPPQLPHPGWFTAIEVAVVDPHVKNKLIDAVTVGGATDTVHLPNGMLDWTVAPRFEAGYRLPSGFGEFVLGYQFLVSSGSEQAAFLDGPGTLSSRLNINTVDLDYASHEWSLWPCWDMKWRFGVRLSSIYFDSKLSEPFATAAAGSGISAEQDSNWYMGAGPHWGLELARRWDDCGLTLVGRVDGWISLGRLEQKFLVQSTATGAGGAPLTGLTQEDRSQAVPQLTVEAGVRWRPPSYHYLSVFAGYHYEYWWDVGRDSDTLSRGELDDQGVVIQLGINF